MTVRAITRCRQMGLLWLPGCCYPVVTGRTGEPLVCAAGIQRGVVETPSETTAGLVALLARIRCRRVRCAFADRANDIACDMATHALLRLDGWILVVDRIGFQEITRRGVTSVALPTVGIHGGVHGIAWMGRGMKDRVVV